MLFLSQIPYTGLELEPLGPLLYSAALSVWALALAYLVLFGVAPFVNRRLRELGVRVMATLNAMENAPPTLAVGAPTPSGVGAVTRQELATDASPSYSSYHGFKSFGKNETLSIEDIVKGLAREHRVEPIYENVEPIFDHAEPLSSASTGGARADERIEPTADVAVSTETVTIPAHTRGFTVALLEGDRAAVFAALRAHVRGEGAPETFIHSAVCLLDDAYRSRVDGTPCDPSIARITERLATPTFEKLIAALTTAIDASYESGITGAKLALTRALGVLGA